MAEYRIDIEKSAQNILDKIYERFGVSAERLVELAKADREGRVVVLPCKVGDTIYRIEYIESDGFKIGIGEHKFDCLFFALERKNFGKTVFFTREAAEEALKAREQK